MGCTTVSGSKPNASCIFPFKFDGITYHECSTNPTPPSFFPSWCSTLVDASGVHVGGQGNYGSCAPDCNKIDKIGKNDLN